MNTVHVYKPNGKYHEIRDVKTVDWNPGRGLTVTQSFPRRDGTYTTDVVFFPSEQVDHYVQKGWV